MSTTEQCPTWSGHVHRRKVVQRAGRFVHARHGFHDAHVLRAAPARAVVLRGEIRARIGDGQRVHVQSECHARRCDRECTGQPVPRRERRLEKGEDERHGQRGVRGEEKEAAEERNEANHAPTSRAGVGRRFIYVSLFSFHQPL